MTNIQKSLEKETNQFLPAPQVRQRLDQQFEGLEEYDHRLETRPRWRFHPSSRTTHSPSSSHWQQSSDRKSNRSWDSWQTSSWVQTRVPTSWAWSGLCVPFSMGHRWSTEEDLRKRSSFWLSLRGLVAVVDRGGLAWGLSGVESEVRTRVLGVARGWGTLEPRKSESLGEAEWVGLRMHGGELSTERPAGKRVLCPAIPQEDKTWEKCKRRKKNQKNRKIFEKNQKKKKQKRKRRSPGRRYLSRGLKAVVLFSWGVTTNLAAIEATNENSKKKEKQSWTPKVASCVFWQRQFFSKKKIQQAFWLQGDHNHDFQSRSSGTRLHREPPVFVFMTKIVLLCIFWKNNDVYSHHPRLDKH